MRMCVGRSRPTLRGVAMTVAMTPEHVASLQDEVRSLARERDAVILAHSYQVPEIQDTDFVGDSLALSRQAAHSDAGASGPAHAICARVSSGYCATHGVT